MFQVSRIAWAFGVMRLAPVSVERTRSGWLIFAARICARFQKIHEEQPLGFGLLTATQEEKTDYESA